MSRRVWAGVAAGVLAALLGVGVAGAAFQAGERHDVVTRTVGDGQVVRVVGDNGWDGGGHFGFFLFPLFVILLVFLLLRGRRGGYGRYWGRGYGPCGSGYGEGAGFEEQHRRAHDRAGPGPSEPVEA